MRENIDWPPPACPPLGIRPTTWACALTGNQICDFLVQGRRSTTEPHWPDKNEIILKYFIWCWLISVILILFNIENIIMKSNAVLCCDTRQNPVPARPRPSAVSGVGLGPFAESPGDVTAPSALRPLARAHLACACSGCSTQRWAGFSHWVKETSLQVQCLRLHQRRCSIKSLE
uniref:Uncharacterized protein n=1 Tax=Molossus molossus TaxID=27622 RepID=A0A7J8HHF2_MOLMO|nr:hypothetical protein HJG59_011073 [Molossus molossus]